MTDLPPLAPRPEVLDFLASRRSRSARTLGGAGPGRAELEGLLALAARVPDHGKLVPWRFVVIAGAARARLAQAALARAAALGLDAAGAEKAAANFGYGAVIVAVLARPEPSAKIPRWEQEQCAAAVCYGLLIAALAAGWGANWLTGPLARDPEFVASALGGAPGDHVAGFIHIGTESVVPSDRERPDLAAITCWLD